MANVMEAGTVWKKSSAATTKLWQSISWAQLDRKVQIWEASSNDSKDSRKKWTSSDTNSLMVWYGHRTGVHMQCPLEHPPMVNSFRTHPNLHLLIAYHPDSLFRLEAVFVQRLCKIDTHWYCTSNPLQHVSAGLQRAASSRPHPPPSSWIPPASPNGAKTPNTRPQRVGTVVVEEASDPIKTSPLTWIWLLGFCMTWCNFCIYI